MTFAQRYSGSHEEYLNYDFHARKKRRDPSIDREIAKENLLLLKKIFDKNKIKFWLIYGTLLGAVREKNFIKHDTDTDLGMYVTDRDKIFNLKDELSENGFVLIRTKYPDDLITFMRNDEYIDLGLFREEKDFFSKYWIYQSNKEKYSYFNHFEEIDFLGEIFLVPSDYMKFIIEHYGNNWNVSQKGFPQIPRNLIGLRRKIKMNLSNNAIGKVIVKFYYFLKGKK